MLLLIDIGHFLPCSCCVLGGARKIKFWFEIFLIALSERFNASLLPGWLVLGSSPCQRCLNLLGCLGFVSCRAHCWFGCLNLPGFCEVCKEMLRHVGFVFFLAWFDFRRCFGFPALGSVLHSV